MKLIHHIPVCLIIFLNLLFCFNEFTEVREDSLDFDSIINCTHYESISVTWANVSTKIYFSKNISFDFSHLCFDIQWHVSIEYSIFNFQGLSA